MYLFKTLLKPTLTIFSILSVCVITSCVDEKYDFRKGLDTTSVLMKDVAIPVGNLKGVSIEKIISLNAEDPMIVMENGNYAFLYECPDKITSLLEVPSFGVSLVENSSGDNHYLTLNTGNLAGKNGPSEDCVLSITNQRLEKIIKVEDADLLPYQIVDVKEVSLSTLIEYNFSVDQGKMSILTGFRIDFPDWLTIEKCDEKDEYFEVVNQGENKNIVSFLKDRVVAVDNPYTLRLLLSKVDIPEGAIHSGYKDSENRDCKKIVLDQEDEKNMIIVIGGVSVNTNDFPTIPQNVSMIMNLEFSDLDMKSALVKLQMDIDADDQVVEIDGYPSFFSSEGVVIDFYDTFLRFNVKNPSPMAFTLEADIKSFNGEVQKVNTHIGGSTEAKKILIEKEWEGMLGFSRRGEDGYKALPELASIISSKPDKITVSNIIIKSATTDFIEINADESFEYELAYEFYAPFAFSGSLALPYELVIQDLDINLGDLGLNSTQLTLDAVNTIPLNFSIQAVALDEDGYVSDDLTITTNGNIESGTLEAPAVTEMILDLQSSNGIILNSLKLILTATCPNEDHHGVVLNKNQSIRVENLAIKLPEGIKLEF